MDGSFSMTFPDDYEYYLSMIPQEALDEYSEIMQGIKSGSWEQKDGLQRDIYFYRLETNSPIFGNDSNYIDVVGFPHETTLSNMFIRPNDYLILRFERVD